MRIDVVASADHPFSHVTMVSQRPPAEPGGTETSDGTGESGKMMK